MLFCSHTKISAFGKEKWLPFFLLDFVCSVTSELRSRPYLLCSLTWGRLNMQPHRCEMTIHDILHILVTSHLQTHSTPVKESIIVLYSLVLFLSVALIPFTVDYPQFKSLWSSVILPNNHLWGLQGTMQGKCFATKFSFQSMSSLPRTLKMVRRVWDDRKATGSSKTTGCN